MEFMEAMRIWKRMCESNGQCEHCPIPAYDATLCRAWVMMHADHANDILAKWAEEHPEKTIMDDFFAKFPKAPRTGAGAPHACVVDIGYSMPPFCDRNTNRCAACWCRPLEEVE